MALCFLLLSLAAVHVFSQTPPNVNNPGPVTPSKFLLDEQETQAWAWLAKRQKESGPFKKMAEGRYFIKANTDLPKSEKPFVCGDIWTLSESRNGDFIVDGMFTESNGNSNGDSFSYQIKLNPQMRPTAFKRFIGGWVSGCVWTKSKFLCQETDRRGRVQGAAGAPIDDSTKFLPHFFSPFLFNGLIPNSRNQSGETTYLTLLTLVYFDEPGYSIDLFPEYGALSLIRRGTYSILDAQMDASEFQLDVREVPNASNTSPNAPVIPPDSEHKDQYRPLWKLLISSNGILLSATDANTHEEFIHLVQFKKLADF
jgi:hypothetical protein